MDRNLEFTKRIFNIIDRLKHLDIMNPNSSDDDIRPSEGMFLVKIDMLSNGDGSSVKVSDLVNKVKFAPSTVSTILKVLEDKGYITRDINQENRREVLVKVTDKGKTKLEFSKKYHFKMVSDLITYLGEDDARKLIQILERTTCFFEEKKQMKGKDNNDKIN